LTTRNAVTLFVLILLLFAADRVFFQGQLPTFVGRQFVGFVEYLSFWR